MSSRLKVIHQVTLAIRGLLKVGPGVNSSWDDNLSTGVDDCRVLWYLNLIPNSGDLAILDQDISNVLPITVDNVASLDQNNPSVLAEEWCGSETSRVSDIFLKQRLLNKTENLLYQG